MKFNIRGDKIEITESIRSYIEEKIGKLNKYLENPSDLTANVVARIANREHIIEVTIPSKKIILRAESRTNDLYSAIDLVSEKLERQIRKNKTRMSKKVNRETVSMFNIDFINEDTEEENGIIVKRKQLEMKPMSEEEAILQMNLLGHDFFVFKNIDNNTLSVIYKRKDNNFGIIESK
ncbi:MAG TPA: ribosome-associated translation inhibitor RaiA [Tenericutes bacterium]|nr:ribosome-associated translation inhibitor RaiA [Mycoplasmatota bacterium]